MKYSISICSNSRERKRNCLQGRNFARSPLPERRCICWGDGSIVGFSQTSQAYEVGYPKKFSNFSLLNSDFVPDPKVIAKAATKKTDISMKTSWPNVSDLAQCFWENLNPECHSEFLFRGLNHLDVTKKTPKTNLSLYITSSFQPFPSFHPSRCPQPWSDLVPEGLANLSDAKRNLLSHDVGHLQLQRRSEVTVMFPGGGLPFIPEILKG